MTSVSFQGYTGWDWESLTERKRKEKTQPFPILSVCGFGNQMVCGCGHAWLWRTTLFTWAQGRAHGLTHFVEADFDHKMLGQLGLGQQSSSCRLQNCSFDSSLVQYLMGVRRNELAVGSWYFPVSREGPYQGKNQFTKTQLNPITAPAGKISGLKDTWTCWQTVYFPVL